MRDLHPVEISAKQSTGRAQLRYNKLSQFNQPTRSGRAASHIFQSDKENEMKYISTRGQVAPIGFIDAILMGLADDGGLLVPDRKSVV